MFIHLNMKQDNVVAKLDRITQSVPAFFPKKRYCQSVMVPEHKGMLEKAQINIKKYVEKEAESVVDEWQAKTLAIALNTRKNILELCWEEENASVEKNSQIKRRDRTWKRKDLGRNLYDDEVRFHGVQEKKT